MYIYLKVQLLGYVWKSFKTYLAFKPYRKKDASKYFTYQNKRLHGINTCIKEITGKNLLK